MSFNHPANARKSFILNADDLGLASPFDRGIIESIKSGVVNSCSLMVTSLDASSLFQQAKFHEASVGLHVNITEGLRFFSSNGDRLFGDNGQVAEALKNSWPIPNGKWKRIFDEFRFQIDEFSKLTRTIPDHINFHHPLYLIPDFSAGFIELMKRIAIPTRWYTDIAHSNLRFPNFTEFGFFETATLTVKTLLDLMDKAPQGVTEIVLHPGFADESAVSSYNQQRTLQVEVLTNSQVTTHLHERGYRLVTFNQLSV